MRHERRAVHGGDAHDKHPRNKLAKREGEYQDMLKEIDILHTQLKDDYKIRWELDRYLIALYYGKSPHLNTMPLHWMVLEPWDTYHYHNLPDIAYIIRSTFMGSCCTPWLQKLFNIFLCGKRYRRLINTSHTTCQLTAAIINVLHGLLLGLYPFNERRTEIHERAWLAGVTREVLTDTNHITFINAHPHLLCLGLAEYIINVIDDFCPVEWSLLAITPSAKSQCLAAFESFRETSISPSIGKTDFWSKIETDAQPVVNSLVKFFKGAAFYQHRPRTIIPQTAIQHLQMALDSKVIQNSSSIFGQLKAAIPSIQFRESEALEEIWTAIYIRQLPIHTTSRQMETLEKAGQMCCLVEQEMHRLPICMACALTKRTDILRGMFRYDAVDERLVCNECDRCAYVVNINMLGRVLCIRDKTITLCDKCMQPKYWDAPCACSIDETASPSHSCCVCTNTNIVSTKEIVDLDSVTMKPMHFCYKHNLSCILNQSTIYDAKSLEQEMHARSAHPGSHAGTGHR